MRGCCYNLGRWRHRPERERDGAKFYDLRHQRRRPQDPLEAMLAAQMSAVHMLTMEFSRRLNNVDNIPQQDSAERALNKLGRTYAAQLDGPQALPE